MNEAAGAAIGTAGADGSFRVAAVLIDSPVPHLDHTFDYRIDPESSPVEPGMRVRVPFSGRTADGLVTAVKDSTDHDGDLATITKTIAPFPLMTAEQLELIDAVAKRYAGTRSDVVRLALPPRHARTEKQVLSGDSPGGPIPRPGSDETALWADYAGGTAFIDRLAGIGGSGTGDGSAAPVPRAAAALLPGTDTSRPADLLAVAAKAAASAGTSALIIAPDYRDLDRLAEALTRRVGPDVFVRLSADEGNAERYRAYLRILRGTHRIVIGTRAAMFAPLRRIGLLAVLEDGDDLLAEPRAPYPHPRDVALLRSAAAGAPLLFAGHSRSTDVQRLVENGYLVDLRASRTAVRSRAPRVVRPDDSQPGSGGRLPESAFRIVRGALGMDKNPANPPGPVLVQVPRAGYVPLLTCDGCRKAARCAHCHGPLEQHGADAAPSCRWCGRPVAAFECGRCGNTALRRTVIGAARTGDELGRAFPGTTMIRSSGDHVLGTIPPAPAIVVATVGAEPVVPGGYAAALLLDGNSLISLPGLRAGEHALRRWLGAAALVRPAADGGAVFIGADEERTVGALVRWDPVGYAERELAERRELSMPPVVRMAALTGPAPALSEFVADAELPDGLTVVGPAPIPDSDDARTLIFFGYSRTDVPAALRTEIAARSARRAGELVRARVDDTGSL